MKTLAVVGPPEAGRRDLVERLVDRLSTHGRVATVRRPADLVAAGAPQYIEAGAAESHAVGDEGWSAAGEGRTLRDVVDDLAPRFDYAVVEGFEDVRLPGVVLGDRDYPGTVVAAGDDAGVVDLDEVVEALRDVEPHVTLESLVARAKASPRAERAGAIATFTGRVRAKDGEDDPRTEFLEFEAYEGVADERMDALAADLEERDGVQEVLLHHRTGRIDYGEDIVFVVVLAGHREEAFRTVEDGIDRLKEEVPIFKREVTVEEEFWVHEKE